MPRAMFALIVVPLCASLVYGQWFPLVMVLLVFPVLCAIPLFLLFAKRGWLRCWQVTAAGLAIGVAFAVLMISDGLYARISGPSRLAEFAALGGAIAWAFWWVGLYRNPRFAGATGGAVRRPLAISILPVLLWGMSRLYEPSLSPATVREASPAQVPNRLVQVQLPQGEVVGAELVGSRTPSAGTSVLVESRRQLWPSGRRYWLIH
ncbi:MAG: hypothetical protein AB1832_15660 [Pseudomonadota bacterium]